MRKIGINLNAYSGLEDNNSLKTIKNIGFDSFFTGTLDLKSQFKIAEAAALNNISYEFVHGPFGHINDIWLDCAAGDEMQNEISDCIDACGKTNVPIVVLHLSSGVTPPTITDIGRKRFEKLVNTASKNNVKIAFENQRLLGNLCWALEYFNTETVGFCWDCGHENCFTPGLQFMPLFGDRLICTHIHDNTCTFNEDAHMLPFDGRIDFQKVARQIQRSGFDGVLMLEAIADASGHYTDMPPQKYLQQAADAAKRLVKMVEADSND